MGDHGPDGARAVAGTDPAFVGAADEFQLRLRGNPRALRARFVRALPTATVARRVGERLRRRARASARPRQAAGPSVRVITRTRVGRRLRAAARARRLRHGRGSRSSTTRSPTNDYAPEDSAGIVLGHRALPPRLQRLERPRLQLPRRQVRPGLRGPRGRHRRAGDRRPGAGLQQRLDRHRVLGTYTDVAASEPGDGGARAPDRLEAHAPRRARSRARSPSPRRAARATATAPARRSRSSASPATATATARPARATCSTASSPTCARARRATPAPLGDADDAHVADRPRRQAVRGRRRAALLRRLLRPPASRSRSRSRPAARRGRYYTGAVAGADGSWVTSVSLPYSASLRAVFPGDSRAADGVQGDRGQGRPEPEDRARLARGRAAAARCG